MSHVIPVNQVRFSKHILVTSSADVASISAPLLQQGITHFAFQKLHKDGSVALLGTHPGFTEEFIKNKLYENTFVGKVDEYISCYALWRDLDCHEIISLANMKFDLGNGFVITKRYEDCCEFFYFASTRENWKINSFYINNIDKLEKFISSFKETAKILLNESDRHRILYPVHGDGSLLISEDWKKMVSISAFDYQLVNHALTDREVECVSFLRLGISAKEIAKLLDISHRTVEKHTENIKQKFGCKSKSQLIASLQNYDLNL